MPNWCSTTYCFRGEKEVLDDFENKINEYTSKEFVKSDFKIKWLGNVLEGFGFSYKYYRCRGIIENIDRVTDNELYISTETAWEPMNDMWDIIISKHYCENGIPLINYTMISEECGMGIYVNTDEYGSVFPEKYNVYIQFNDEAFEYYESLYLESDNNLIENINDIFKTDFKSVDEVFEFADKINENDDDNYLGVHLYKYDIENYGQKVIDIKPGIIFD